MLRKTIFAAALAVGITGAVIAEPVCAVDENPRTVMNGYVRYVEADDGGEGEPAGWILAPEAEQTTRYAPRLSYLEQAVPLGGFAAWEGMSVEVQGEFIWDPRTPRQRDQRIYLPEVLRVDTIAAAPPEGLLRAQLLADLDARGIDILNANLGNDRAPVGSLGEDGRCADGGAADRVILEWPPVGSADMYATIAFLCEDSGQYWANRGGGFGGWSTWVGPFEWSGPFPGAGIESEGAPKRVSPRQIRLRKRERTRRVTIRRDWSAPDGGRVRRRDYSPDDFDLGPGIRVLKVLRASKRRIRLRVSVSPDAVPGMRDVAVHGRVGEDLLMLMPSR